MITKKKSQHVNIEVQIVIPTILVKYQIVLYLVKNILIFDFVSSKLLKLIIFEETLNI